MSRLPFSDSGYYLDNKKDAKKLDSGYYLYVLKNVYLLLIKPTSPQLPEEITNKNRSTAFKALSIKSTIWLYSKPYYNVYLRITCTKTNIVSKVSWVWWYRLRYSWIGLLLLTVTDVWTTGAVVIFREKWLRSITPHSDSEDELADRLSKRQSLATTTLLVRTTFTRTIKLDKN